MKLSTISLGITAAITLSACTNDSDPAKTVTGVDFIGMDAPVTAVQRATVYSDAQVSVTYSDGTTATKNLEYKQLFATTDSINAKTVGGLYDALG